MFDKTVFNKIVEKVVQLIHYSISTMSNKGPPSPFPVYQKSSEPAISEAQIVSGSFGITIRVLFLLFACLLFISGNSESQNYSTFLSVFSIYFTSIVLEALPFMLIGTLAGGIIEVFVPVTLIDRFFGKKQKSAVFLAGGLGLFFPTCECAIVPIVRRLILKGIPVPSAICFMLSGPIVNIIVVWSTAIAYTFNWKMVLLRFGCGYVVAVTIGLLLSCLSNPQKLVNENIEQLTVRQCGCVNNDYPKNRLITRLMHAIGHARNDFIEVGKFLVIGAFIAAFLRAVAPISSIDGLSTAPWFLILLMMGMAVFMNLCSEADAFIAASFRWILPGSAQLGFLVLGPMLDLKLMMMYLSVFRKRTIVLLSVATFGLVYCLMLLIEAIIPPFV